jgi:hypothetical protein
MSWDAIGAISELVAVIAVVATLVYLSFQLRQNTLQMENYVKAIDLTACNAIDESFSRFRMMLAANPEVADLWRRAKEDYLSLSGMEKEQADALPREWFVIYQNTHHRTTSIVLANSMMPGESKDDYMEFLMTRELGHPDLRQWYKNNTGSFFQHFKQSLSAHIARVSNRHITYSCNH